MKIQQENIREYPKIREIREHFFFFRELFPLYGIQMLASKNYIVMNESLCTTDCTIRVSQF